jgi:hypothetical protein
MGVEFNEGNNFNRRDFGKSDEPKIASWLISKGLAKDLAGANKLQLIAALVFFALAIFFAVS